LVIDLAMEDIKASNRVIVSTMVALAMKILLTMHHGKAVIEVVEEVSIQDNPLEQTRDGVV
jgi:hypothetical protein